MAPWKCLGTPPPKKKPSHRSPFVPKRTCAGRPRAQAGQIWSETGQRQPKTARNGTRRFQDWSGVPGRGQTPLGLPFVVLCWFNHTRTHSLTHTHTHTHTHTLSHSHTHTHSLTHTHTRTHAHTHGPYSIWDIVGAWRILWVDPWTARSPPTWEGETVKKLEVARSESHAQPLQRGTCVQQ